MADCRWLEPERVGQFEFLEWIGDNHLRHTRFVGLRDDKAARDVRREQPSTASGVDTLGRHAIGTPLGPSIHATFQFHPLPPRTQTG
jgi:hypothetical protein